MVSAAAVSTISLAYSNTASWAVFNSNNRCSAGDLQSNWDYITSQIGAYYKTLLNSAVDEIGVHSATIASTTADISSISSSLASATADISALTVSAPYAGSAGYAVSAAYAVSAGTAKYA